VDPEVGKLFTLGKRVAHLLVAHRRLFLVVRRLDENSQLDRRQRADLSKELESMI
jgi:hypothetical protein